MFQRSVIVNSLLASLIWFHAQTYPLPIKWSKKLNVILFNFIWNSKVEPIARSTLNIDRDKGFKNPEQTISEYKGRIKLSKYVLKPVLVIEVPN